MMELYSSWGEQDSSRGEFEIIGPETKVLHVEDWGRGGKDLPLVADPPWEDVEHHIKNLENKSLALRYKGSTLQISGNRTPDSFVIGANVNPAIFTPYIYSIHVDAPHGWRDMINTEFTGSLDMVIGGQRADYPAEGQASLEASLRIAKVFHETGELDPGVGWDNPPPISTNQPS